MRMVWVLMAVAIIVLALPCAAEQFTYVDLVSKLTDLEGLATLPASGDTCTQWSSYDRASYYDAATGKYVGWDANGDGSGYIRKEGDTFVFAEMEGPGCIWRMWSALAQEGHVRIYLDGAAEPTVDLPFDGYFNLQNKPFIYPGLVHDASSGRNCYVPIPYQKSCKIVADNKWGAYFHYTYTTYPKDTILPTFTRDLGPNETAALEKASKFITKSLGTDPTRRKGQTIIAPMLSVAPGETAMIAQISGPSAITCIRAMINDKAYTEDQLRSAVLKIYWDGEKQPSVWAPIGDFFGTAPGLRQYKSLPLGVTATDAYSYWYMPFGKEAIIELANEGKTPFATQFFITSAPLSKPIADLGRFHAKWHRDAFLPTEPERSIDWPMLKTEGRGRFCGVSLEIWNPKGGWWGEGDEKYFVDGEKFPSTIGTGSEDYFGYAWGNPALFENAYHNQTRNDNNNNASHIAVNRWLITDSVPFQKSFEGDIEKYFPNSLPSLDAVMAYWYLASDGKDPYQAVALKDRVGWAVAPIKKKIPGFVEGENMKTVSIGGGGVGPQMLSGEWSENTHLYWTKGKPGDKLVLELPVAKPGKCDLVMAFTKASDYAIVQMWLDGVKIGNPIDFYNDGVIPTGPVSFGVFDLKAGAHQITAEIVGANEKAIKAYMFGLDYVQLKRAK